MLHVRVGEVLASVETKQAPNSCAAVSPCGKFIACSGTAGLYIRMPCIGYVRVFRVSLVITGFTPDVKIWEVEFSKGGDFQQMSRAMELKGHSATVLSLSFNGDSQRCVYSMGIYVQHDNNDE